MSVYIDSIRTAVCLFPLLAALLTVPYLLYQYHRYGAVSPPRSVLLCSFLFYLLCAYFLVILPLPGRAEVAALETPWAQLVPFSFVGDLLRHSSLRPLSPATWLPALSERVVLEPLFNVLLTLPFGAYVAYYFGGGRRRTVLLTLLLSLFFECTQLSGLYGLYPRPYRLFDVDDLLLNTLGGALGWRLGLWAASFLPTRSWMDFTCLRRALRVGYLRRLAALSVDAVVVGGAALALIRVGASPWVSFALPYFLYFVVLQALWGQTPGKALVRIRLRPRPATHPLIQHLFTRYVLLLLPPAWLLFSLRALESGSPWLMAMALMSDAALCLLLAADCLYGLRQGKRRWHDRLCGMVHESTVGMLPVVLPRR